jgi:hypothetical protein
MPVGSCDAGRQLSHHAQEQAMSRAEDQLVERSEHIVRQPVGSFDAGR